MAHVVVMPKLGNTVESCIIVKWDVAEGQDVNADTVLCEIETDKATMEVPAGVSGKVLKILRAEGDDVPVMEPIVVVGAAGESVELALKEAGFAGAASAGAATAGTGVVQAAQVAQAEKAPLAAQDAQNMAAGGTMVAGGAEQTAMVGISPRAKHTASEAGLSANAVKELVGQGTGPGGRIIERDVAKVLEEAPKLTATARGIAALNELYESGKKAGSGLGGRMTAADVAAVAAGKNAAEAKVARGTTGADALGGYTETPIKSIRKIIAERMMQSLQSSAQLTFNASAPADKLLALRARLKNSDPTLGLSGVTVGDLVGYAAVQVVKRYPRINAHVIDNVIRSYEHVHLGLAVDTPRGLMVPVVKNADTLNLRQFSEESKRLAKGCLDGSVNPDDLTGATFTATNLGAFGIESFTPILNTPETGILGVDCIMPRPTQASVERGGEPQFEMRIGFSLTVDHRVVDGADAARYLKDLSNYIANIDIAVLA
ncbi:MAG TPA: dihydrolipoamide acetyltransferase family protein [Spirochaetales bacterium]|nr:dihydrolipoamide acetyltransferase family protein [Spirochaetales bacterium]